MEEEMKVIYAGQPFCPSTNRTSIFLAGPTPRSLEVNSWRPNAIDILKNTYNIRYRGIVLVPETPDGKFPDYEAQIEWEHYCLENCSIIAFWVPREMKTMPGMTTNVEFGMYIKSKRVIYGRPVDAPKNGYLDYCYRKFVGEDPFNDLEELLTAADRCLDDKGFYTNRY